MTRLILLRNIFIPAVSQLRILSMSEDCTNIIDILIETRRLRHMTQAEVASASGLTQSVIARLESKKTIPQLDTLLKVTEALHCKLTVSQNTD
ncbi:helix-turn-helix transcriptional regulator [Stomatobaculum sp. F0698]|uniref:helix-turn-helix domain-containing protein n=1 Tax=Stomatobaculum sp. F0698 TaxID=3059030 RepID=UPI002729E03A|nr:helix-turn-helix transcriptional regulator [Stomatobaculum sp. F0698]WLD86894.1 helix-turn-helix transcriptional regulator [Stomatobaculum sp. F0698]